MDPGPSFGAALGRVLIPLALLLWGMQKCRTSAQKPGSNQRAFGGLMFSLGAWAFLLLQSAFAVVLPTIAAAILLAAIAAMGLSGAILGARGLVASQRLGAETQAAIAVLIGLALPGLVGYGLYSGWIKGRSAGAVNPPRVVAVPAFGFWYQLPDPPWMELEAAKVNPNARLTLGRVRPAMAFVIMADRTDNDGVSGADLVPWLRTSLASQGTPSRFEDVAHRVGSYAGTRVLVETPARRYVVWLYGAGSSAYALMLSTGDDAIPEPDLLAEGERLFLGFSTSP